MSQLDGEIGAFGSLKKKGPNFDGGFRTICLDIALWNFGTIDVGDHEVAKKLIGPRWSELVTR
jgi:hypothetical protein